MLSHVVSLSSILHFAHISPQYNTSIVPSLSLFPDLHRFFYNCTRTNSYSQILNNVTVRKHGIQPFFVLPFVTRDIMRCIYVQNSTRTISSYVYYYMDTTIATASSGPRTPSPTSGPSGALPLVGPAVVGRTPSPAPGPSGLQPWVIRDDVYPSPLF